MIIPNNRLLKVKKELLDSKVSDRFSILYESVKQRLDLSLKNYEHDTQVQADAMTRKYLERLHTKR